MKDWYREENYFVDRVGIKKYIPKNFISPTQYLTAMLSRLHGEVDYTNFKTEWLPIVHGVMLANIVFNWASMLSQCLLKALEKAVRKQDLKGTIFYFSTYLLDVLCVSNLFPGMNWDWTPQILPIHLYYKDLWRENSYEKMYKICDHFITNAHQLLFGIEMPRLSVVGWESISLIGNWYMLKNFTYIHHVGTTIAPHLLLK